MSFGKIAPQAYTKQILQEAFEWWSEQPESLRHQIQDSDDLVGYYLKMQRGGTEKVQPSKPDNFSTASKESFSSELKGLAEDLNGFEGYSEEKALHSGGGAFKHEKLSRRKKTKSSVQQQLPFPTMSHPLAVTTESNKFPVVQGENADERFFKLDGRSLAMVREARELLNLSSDEEALRALISFGAQKFKTLLRS